MRQRVEIRVVHESGDHWVLNDEEGPEPSITVDTEIRGREWLAVVNYTKGMYHDIAARSCYADVVGVEIWTAGVLGQRLYSYGRNGETFEDPTELQDYEGEEDVA